jgi:hypothetical protein
LAKKLSVGQVNAWRLGKHSLVPRATGKDVARVVSDICGIQAQVLSAAELAIRARVEGVGQQDVRNALWKDHAILKTWCMRGTLHLLATSDLPLYVAALKTKLEEAVRWLQKDGGVTPSEVASITEGIREALRRGSLTREELTRNVALRLKLKPKTRKYLMSPWGVLLRPAAYQGILAFGESLGPNVTFASPASWVGRWREPSPTEAILDLFRRYLGCYGPATVSDFGHWWGGLQPKERSALDSFVPELEQVVMDGFEGLMLKRGAEEASGLEPARGVKLLPSFDPYPMFYSPREKFVPRTHKSRIFRQTAGWNYPALVVDGYAAGIWNLKKRSGRVEIEVEPFRALNSREREGVQAEAKDIARFLDTSSEIRYGQIGPM